MRRGEGGWGTAEVISRVVKPREKQQSVEHDKYLQGIGRNLQETLTANIETFLRKCSRGSCNIKG